MRYENRMPPEGINTSDHSPLREFLRLSLSALVVLITVAIFLNFTGSILGGLLPFKAELWITQRVDRIMREADQPSPFGDPIGRRSDTDSSDTNSADGNNSVANESYDRNAKRPVDSIELYLQTLADKVVAALELPEPIAITLHYSEDDVFNAYATLGGHVFLFKGLLKYLPNENALAMLMAHEFSHVEQRHPAKSVGGGLTVAVGSSLLLGAAAFENRFFSMASALTSTRFSRSMETEADRFALTAVNSMYGHVNGADDLFELFVGFRDDGSPDVLESFFSTHPLDSNRIQSIDEQARANGWLTEGAITPLPANFSRWLEQ